MAIVPHRAPNSAGLRNECVPERELQAAASRFRAVLSNERQTDRIALIFDQAKGAVKDAAGKLMGDAKLQADGKADKAKGKAENAVGGVKDAIGDATK